MLAVITLRVEVELNETYGLADFSRDAEALRENAEGFASVPEMFVTLEGKKVPL